MRLAWGFLNQRGVSELASNWGYSSRAFSLELYRWRNWDNP
jgi:hypothetical protein